MVSTVVGDSALSLRRRNVTNMLDCGAIKLVDVVETMLDSSVRVTGQKLVLNEAFFYAEGEKELTLQGLVELTEYISATYDVAFKFWFDSSQEYRWHGGLYKWQKQLDMPSLTSDEEVAAFNELKIPIERFQGRWMKDDPDLLVFDKDMPNLFCQILITLFEIYGEELHEIAAGD